MTDIPLCDVWEVCRGKFPMLSEHLTHSWDRPHTPLRLTGCNEEDFNAHVGQTPSPSGNKDGNEQTLSACTDLSMRIASVFRSFSSQVSLSSAMIFSDSWTKGKLWEKPNRCNIKITISSVLEAGTSAPTWIWEITFASSLSNVYM